MRSFLILMLFFIAGYCSGQGMDITGNVQDTAAKGPLRFAVVMAVKLSDSVLVKFTRTDVKGDFALKDLPVDTYQVIITHPLFSEQVFLIVGSNTSRSFEFGKIILPPKSVSLKEVVIYAFKDPVYFKGDTLVYTADSFKVKPNATVEDLLKKLPGVKVDGQGKVSVQGTAVDQVLVDGDEFFGADPTVATRNLSAKGVESVQVYEKKNDNAAGEETIKVMDLKLKDEAKKGYFGKLSAASDLTKFYEGELLVNKFKNKQKVSLFALGSNTPKMAFDWNDSHKYGMEEFNRVEMENGGYYYRSDNANVTGIPQTFKSGFYFNDKISPKTKLVMSYSLNTNEVKTKTETATQHFLTDTAYATSNVSESHQNNTTNQFQMNLEHAIDSLTDIELKPRLKLSRRKKNAKDNTSFFNNSKEHTRTSNVMNDHSGQLEDFSNNIKIKRRFKKKDRLLHFDYRLDYNHNTLVGTLLSKDNLADTINQKKENLSNSQSHNFSINYTEPLSLKSKLRFDYDYFYNRGTGDKKTLDFVNGGYTQENPLFTNSFENRKYTQRLGTRYIYEVKKYRFEIGMRLRHVLIASMNLDNSMEPLSQKAYNLLPHMGFRYRFSNNKNLSINYSSSSQLPDISQLQPLPDNTNPNYIKEGNPSLKPSFTNRFSIGFSTWKALSKLGFWGGTNYTLYNNDFVNAIHIDSIGRTFSRPVNVNGNYRFSLYADGSIPFGETDFSIAPHVDVNYSVETNFVNEQQNKTRNTGLNPQLGLSYEGEKLSFTLGGGFNYGNSKSTLNNQRNKPYSSQEFSASFNCELPGKINILSDVTYNFNSNRASGYNIAYFLWNAGVDKRLLKKENLIVSAHATDILNQNISTNRIIEDNRIIDTKGDVVRRYVLFKVLYKFNSDKKKEADDF